MQRQRRLFLLAALFCAGAASAAEMPEAITVYAAASLTNVLQQQADAFSRASGIVVKLSFAASSTLAKQIDAGAPADVFISADQDWMDYLEQRARIQKASRHELLGNRLVLIAPADSAVALQIAPGFALTAALKGGRLALGDPDSVPAGRYARSALGNLGVWNDVADHIVKAEDVRGALAFVARGEAPLGIVYETDARADKRVRTVAAFPATSHPPIVYPLALTTNATGAALQFVQYLRNPANEAVFESYGFTVLH